MTDQKKETVEISKIQLDGIVSRLEELEKEKKQHESGNYPKDEWREVEDEEAHRTATVRTEKGKYAIDWIFDRKVFNEKEKEMEFFYKITWLLPDGKNEETEMKLIDFAKLERVSVKIIDKDVKKIEKVVGKTPFAKVDYNNYKTDLGKKVDMKVIAYKTTFTVELPDKRTIKLPEGRLNA